MKKSILLIIAGFALTATACDEKTYTVKEFEADKTLQKTFLDKCKNGEIHPDNLNCINARKARNHNRNLNLD